MTILVSASIIFLLLVILFIANLLYQIWARKRARPQQFHKLVRPNTYYLIQDYSGVDFLKTAEVQITDGANVLLKTRTSRGNNQLKIEVLRNEGEIAFTIQLESHTTDWKHGIFDSSGQRLGGFDYLTYHSWSGGRWNILNQQDQIAGQLRPKSGAFFSRFFLSHPSNYQAIIGSDVVCEYVNTQKSTSNLMVIDFRGDSAGTFNQTMAFAAAITLILGVNPNMPRSI